MKALFISTQYLKRKSIIDGNVDSDKLVQFIETAQDIHIQNYTGTNLYVKLQNLITTIDVGGTEEPLIDLPENSNYKNLLNTYIKPMLAWFAQAEYLPFSLYTVNNGGVFKHRSDNSDQVNPAEIAGLAKRAEDKALFYTNRFIEYMNDNGGLFPEYNSAQDDMHPEKDISSMGWVL